MRNLPLIFAIAILLGTSAVSEAQQAQTTRSEWITLGTAAGPIPNPDRAQAANLLRYGDSIFLVDAGEGASAQLAKVGIRLDTVQVIFLSHLHFDHTAGLLAILGTRFQANMPGEIVVYGPPGTRELVNGLIAAMQPLAEIFRGGGGGRSADPYCGIRVEELRGGEQVALGGIVVTAVENSHYRTIPCGRKSAAYQSLSLRFDLPDRSIVYTGDTGPSVAVEQLAKGADLLVSEVIDPEAALAEVERAMPLLPDQALPTIRRHFSEEHLTGEAAGELARRAGVRRLILTHVSIGDRPTQVVSGPASRAYGQPVKVANDLDNF